MFNIYAQNIITGNATAKSQVETTIEGNGSVQTHIEVSANGQKKSLDASQPGTYRLEVSSSESGSENSSPSATNSYSPPPKITNEKKAESTSPISAIVDFLNKLLKSIDKLFGK